MIRSQSPQMNFLQQEQSIRLHSRGRAEFGARKARKGHKGHKALADIKDIKALDFQEPALSHIHLKRAGRAWRRLVKDR